MKLIPIPKKKPKLRAIDQGSIYDITGQMRKMTRSIERGEDGEASDVIVIIARKNTGNRSSSIETFHWGTGSVADAHWMISTAKNRIEPA